MPHLSLSHINGKLKGNLKTPKTPKDPPSATSSTSNLANGPTANSQSALNTEDKAIGNGGSLWDKAYEMLRQDNYQLLDAFEKILASETEVEPSSNPGHGDKLEREKQMSDLVAKKLAAMDEKQWRIKMLSGKPVIVREQVHRIVKIVLVAKDFGSSLASIDPIHAGLPWAGVYMLLPLILNDTKQHSVAIDGTEYISQIVRRYAEIERIYLQAGDLIDTKDLQAEIVKLYKWVLDYEARAACQFNRNAAIRIARNIVEADGWDSILESLQTSDTTCAKFIDIIDSRDQRHGRRHLENILAEQDSKIEKLIRSSRDHDEKNHKLLSELQHRRQMEEERTCHQTLRTSEYERYKSRNPDRVEGTCEWLLQHSNFKQWLESDESSLLWVSADPGCGKSVLSKSLIDLELRSTGSRTTCYFFFKDDNLDQMSISRALCASLHQMFTLKPMLLKHALSGFRHNGERICEIFSLLWTILLRAAADPEAGEIILVLDALDECEESGRFELIDRLCHLYSYPVNLKSSRIRLKILVTSRPYFNIERGFGHLTSAFPTVRLAGEEETESISLEIEKVIKAKVKETGDALHLADSVRVSLEKRLWSVQHRTYLWLKLIFDLIPKQLKVTEKSLLRMIERIPDTIDKAYTAILDRSTDRPRAKKLLHIVVAARRPLSLREMNAALAIEEDSRSYEDLDLESEESFRTTVRNLCGLFVSVIDSKIFLIHQTAKQFLIGETAIATVVDQSIPSLGYWKRSLRPAESNSILAKSCISYLLFEVFESQPSIWEPDEMRSAVNHHGATKDQLTKYRALDQSTRSNVALEHSKTDYSAPTNEALNDGASDDEASENEASDGRASDDRAPDDRTSENKAPEDTALGDEVLDHRALNDKILDDEALVHAVSDDSASDDAASDEEPQFTSFEKGFIFDQYLELHAFLEYSAVYWTSHFQAADINDEILVLKSASQVCNPQSRRFWAWFPAHARTILGTYTHSSPITHLMAVSYLGLKNLAQWLLLQGVDVNETAQSVRPSTAVALAAYGGHMGVVGLLLEKGADPNIRAEGESPVLLEQIKSVRWLPSANPEALDNPQDQTGIHEVWVAMEKVVKSLIENGSNIYDKYNFGGTAVNKGSLPGCQQVTGLLLEYSMSSLFVRLRHARDCITSEDISLVSMKDKQPMSTWGLQEKPFTERLEIARLLLEHGADPEAEDSMGTTALDELIWDHREIVHMYTRVYAREA